MNKVPEEEHKRLHADEDRKSVGTKCLWLESSAPMRPQRVSLLWSFKNVCTRTSRLLPLKDIAAKLWDYVSTSCARQTGLTWAAPIPSGNLEAVVRAAWMVRKHLNGNLDAVVLRATIAAAESSSASIQPINAMARAYRNYERLCKAILFHLSGFDL